MTAPHDDFHPFHMRTPRVLSEMISVISVSAVLLSVL